MEARVFLHDSLIDFREMMESGGELEYDTEYACPFCFEKFDVVRLCCHIDDHHPLAVRNTVCPICQVRFGIDMVTHITTEHKDLFKMQRTWRLPKGPLGTQSATSFVRKQELRELMIQSRISSYRFAPAPATASAVPDPLLSSFINVPVAKSLKNVEPEPLDGGVLNKIFEEKVVARVVPGLSDKDQKEISRRSEFVQELMMSTMLD